MEGEKMKKTLIVSVIILALLLVGCGGPSDGSGTEVVTNGEDQQGYNPETSEDAKFGTRKNPVPLGTEVKVGPNWNIAILEINPDAWPIVQKENQFNDPPEEGYQFVMAKVKASYVGEESGTPWVCLSLRYLGTDGNTYDSGIGVLPKPFSDIGEQFPGASAEGYIGWSVPADVIKGGAIIVEESFSFDDTRVFFVGVQ
jgi:hypothetical protein